MTSPLAVVTVVRDDLAGLRVTFASLREQTWRRFDWIVVDGGSTDGTVEWLRRHDREIKWWRSAPDRGVYHAMNIGWKAATAEAVMFLNAGDRLAEIDTVARISNIILSNVDVDLFYGDAFERKIDGSIVLKTARNYKFVCVGMFTHHQAMVYRRINAADTKFDERYHIGADYAFTIEIISLANRIVRLTYPICVVAPPGLSARNPRQGRYDQFRIRCEILRWGRFFAAAVNVAQWVAQLVRDHCPRIYFRLRYRGCESYTTPDIKVRDPKTNY